MFRPAPTSHQPNQPVSKCLSLENLRHLPSLEDQKPRDERKEREKSSQNIFWHKPLTEGKYLIQWLSLHRLLLRENHKWQGPTWTVSNWVWQRPFNQFERLRSKSLTNWSRRKPLKSLCGRIYFPEETFWKNQITKPNAVSHLRLEMPMV